MQRRKFIKYSCALCAGTTLLSTILESCTGPKNLYKAESSNNEISIPLSSFGEHNYVLVRTEKLSNDIFVSRKSENSYHAFLMKCTHRDSPLQYTSGGLVCNEHGSRFNFDGEVIQAPAINPLTIIPVKLIGHSLTLKINNL